MNYPLRESCTGQPTLSRIIVSALLLMLAIGLTTAQSEQPRTAKEYLKRGLALQREGDLDRAIKDYTQAIKLDPNEADAYTSRGLALLDKRKFDAAIEDFTRLISLRPQDAKSYFNRGLAYLEKGNYEAAVQDFTQAISLNPQLDRPYLGRAQAYRKLGKNDFADEDERKGQEVGWQIAEARCKASKTTTGTFSPEKATSQPVPVDSCDHQQTAAAMVAGLQYAGLKLGKQNQAYSTTVQKSAGKLPANASQGQLAEYVLTADQFHYALLGITDNSGFDSDQWFRLWVNELKRLDVTPKGDPMQLGIAIRATPKLIDLDRRNFACANDELVAIRNLKRLRSISPELLRRWHAVLTRQWADVHGLVLVHLIIAQDSVFERSNLVEDRSQRTLQQLQSLPAESLKAWAELTSYPSLDAAFSLLTVQSLFSGESFVKERFDAALPFTQIAPNATSKVVAQENKSTKIETTTSPSPQDEARQSKDIAQSPNQATPKDASSNREAVTPQADLSGVWTYERSTPKGAVKGTLELSRANSLDDDGYIAFLGVGTYKNKKDAPEKEVPWLVAIKGKKVLVCIEGPCSVFGCAGSLTNDGEIVASCQLLTTRYAGEFKAKRLGKGEAQKLKQR